MVGNSDNEKIVNQVVDLLKKKVKWNNPFGNGDAAKQIIDIAIMK